MSQNPYQPPGYDYPPPGAPIGPTGDLEKWRRYRQYVVYAALGLLVLSFVVHITVLAYVRSACWLAAGILSLKEGSAAKAAGVNLNTTFSALLYFAVAVLPLVRGM